MLVLTRRPQESVRIGTSVTVTVLAVLKDRVRLGISAPQELTIGRERSLPSGSPDSSDSSAR